MFGLMALHLILSCSSSQTQEGGTSVFPPNPLASTPVGGLENTNSTSEIVSISGQPFKQAVRVTVRKRAADSNTTQMTIPNSEPIRKGDVMLARVWIRGKAGDSKPARVEFLFEKATNPWTKSIWQPLVSPSDGTKWKQYLIPFASAEDYGKGAAMASLRFATAIQQVEIGGLEVVNFGKSKSLEDLVELCMADNKLGNATLTVDMKKTAQTMMGMGGNFCQPRYGHTVPLDRTGQYCLDNLKVAHARIGLPLNYWNPSRGVYKNEAQAKASFLALQEMKKRGIPTVVSVWVGPEWMVGPDRNGMVLKPEMVDLCIESIAEYLKAGRDEYGVEPEYFSFNEPDYGVNFKFDPPRFIDFIKRAGEKFKKMGIKTKFLVADTANGANFGALAGPLLEDKAIAQYLGPIAFHCWDALGAQEDVYRGIAELGRKYKKPVWCLEAGHDAALWEKPNPWLSWDNAFGTATAYAKTVRLTEASLMDYWTYQNNYPLIDEDTGSPHPIFHVMKQMQDVLAAGRTVVLANSSSDEIQYVVTTKSKGFAVLVTNPIGAGTLALKGLTPNAKAQVIVSTKESQGKLAKLVTTDAAGAVSVALPTRSVVTVVSQ